MAYPNYPYQQYPQQMYNPQMMQQQMPQQMQMAQQMPQQVQVPQQMQNGGFMLVRSEQEARSYPVAAGNVITFKIENQPIVCEKAQGFSQLEGPVFTKYRLVKENEVPDEPVEAPAHDDDLRDEIEELKREVKALKDKIYSKPKNKDNQGGHRE